MSCGCADRMRRLVLPRFGYQREGGDWVTSSERVPAVLRRLTDTEVACCHGALMARLALAVGRAAFDRWWRTVWNT